MMGFLISFFTGGETPVHRQARVQEAERAVQLASCELSTLVSSDTRHVRRVFEDILTARDNRND